MCCGRPRSALPRRRRPLRCSRAVSSKEPRAKLEEVRVKAGAEEACGGAAEELCGGEYQRHDAEHSAQQAADIVVVVVVVLVLVLVLVLKCPWRGFRCSEKCEIQFLTTLQPKDLLARYADGIDVLLLVGGAYEHYTYCDTSGPEGRLSTGPGSAR